MENVYFAYEWNDQRHPIALVGSAEEFIDLIKDKHENDIIEFSDKIDWIRIDIYKGDTKLEIDGYALVKSNHPKNSIDLYAELIDQWFNKNGQSFTLDKQILKFFEEAGELAQAHLKGKEEEFKDALGDVFVTLVGISRVSGHDLLEAIKMAYNEIKDREITTVDGVGVKKDDL